jgi:hypothetical protein
MSDVGARSFGRTMEAWSSGACEHRVEPKGGKCLELGARLWSAWYVIEK